MTTAINGILFDVGGVLVTLDGAPSLSKLMGVDVPYAELHELWMKSPSVVSHETGKISADEFAAGVVIDLKLPISADAFLRDFGSWPGSLQPGALELIRAIPSRYRVAALSNTCALHWERITALGLAQCFERAYLSHEIGCLKPSREAFTSALDGMGLQAEDVVFLDDAAPNVAAAKSLGMMGYVVKNAAEARVVLTDLGIV